MFSTAADFRAKIPRETLGSTAIISFFNKAVGPHGSCGRPPRRFLHALTD